MRITEVKLITQWPVVAGPESRPGWHCSRAYAPRLLEWREQHVPEAVEIAGSVGCQLSFPPAPCWNLSSSPACRHVRQCWVLLTPRLTSASAS